MMRRLLLFRSLRWQQSQLASNGHGDQDDCDYNNGDQKVDDDDNDNNDGKLMMVVVMVVMMMMT